MVNQDTPPGPTNRDLDNTKDSAQQNKDNPEGGGSGTNADPPTPLFLAYCEVDGEWVVALTPPGKAPTPADGTTIAVGSRIAMTLKNDDDADIDVLFSMSSLESAYTSTRQNGRLRARQLGPKQTDASTKEVTGDSLTIQIARLTSGDPQIQLATDKSTPTVLETCWNGEYWVITNEGTNGIIVDPESIYYVNQQPAPNDVWLEATDRTLDSSGNESICAIFEKKKKEERDAAESWADVLQYGELESSSDTFEGNYTMETGTTYTMNLYETVTSATITLKSS